MPSQVSNASFITLVALNAPKPLEISTELCNRLTKTFEGRFLTVSNKIGIMFYGKMLKFEVTAISDSGSQDSLEDNFNNLLVNDAHIFYRATETTKWRIYRYKLKINLYFFVIQVF